MTDQPESGNSETPNPAPETASIEESAVPAPESQPAAQRAGEAGDTTGSDAAVTVTIEGGDVTDADDAADVRSPDKKTRQALTYVIFLFLGATVILHYISLGWLLDPATDADQIESLEGVFGIWLPVISGLAGSAVTYFFTREGS